MGWNTPPVARGTSTMSRGTETIETVLPTGSSEATIIVSVRAVLRPTPESTPMSRIVMRGGRATGWPTASRTANPTACPTRSDPGQG